MVPPLVPPQAGRRCQSSRRHGGAWRPPAVKAWSSWQAWPSASWGVTRVLRLHKGCYVTTSNALVTSSDTLVTSSDVGWKMIVLETWELADGVGHSDS